MSARSARLYDVHVAISEAERQRRRELAKRLVAEGKIGGNRGGGRPKKKSATELALEKLQDEADSIVQALRDGIDPTKEKSATNRARNAHKILELEMEHEKEERAKEKDLSDMKKDEIIDGLLDMLGKFRGLPEFASMFADTEVIDADVVGIED